MHPKHLTNKVGLVPVRYSLVSSLPRDGARGKLQQGSSHEAVLDSSLRGNDKGEGGDERAIECLIQLPKPKAGDAASDMLWGLARGTVRHKDTLKDLRTLEVLRDTPPECIEEAADAARVEAREELGVLPEWITPSSFRDCGVHDYASHHKGIYPIHFFSCELIDVPLEQLKAGAMDSLDVGWYTLAQMEAMAADGHFKAGYLPIVRKILDKKVTG